MSATVTPRVRSGPSCTSLRARRTCRREERGMPLVSDVFYAFSYLHIGRVFPTLCCNSFAEFNDAIKPGSTIFFPVAVLEKTCLRKPRVWYACKPFESKSKDMMTKRPLGTRGALAFIKLAHENNALRMIYLLPGRFILCLVKFCAKIQTVFGSGYPVVAGTRGCWTLATCARSPCCCLRD